MRQAIAQRTSESAAKIPHFYLRATADVTALVDTRRQIVERIEKTANVRITYTDFLLRAVALALRRVAAAPIRSGKTMAASSLNRPALAWCSRWTKA